METIKAILAVIAIFSLAGADLVCAEDKLSAQEIAQHRFDANRGWKNLSATIHMELRQGATTATRELQIKMLEQEGSGESNLLRVLKPADLSGTVLLTTTHDSGQEEQWLYLPVIKRVKRIALESKGGAFLSSQFSFENLAPFQVQKYHYRRLADENYAGVPCYVLESTPVDSSSVYGRLINWISQRDYRLAKTQFFDKDNLLEKTLYVEKHERYQDKYWRAVQLRMVSEKTRSITTAAWSNLSYDEHIDTREFDATNLKRIGF